MTVVNDLVDEWNALATARLPWEKAWRTIARYVMPYTEGFETLISTNWGAAVSNVVSTPTAAEKSKDLYDMTSLWGIERLTAGLISLKTPETEYWHGNVLDDLFGQKPTYREKLALEQLRNYQFKVRANPKSGFWDAHRSAMKSMCAFGDGWFFIEEQNGKGPQVPYRYEYLPIIECYPGMAPNGMPDRMFRPFRWSAIQIAERFGLSSGKKVIEFANDPKKRHETFVVMHAVFPRQDFERAGRIGVHGSSFQSHYCLPDEKHHIGDGGYYEYPFTRYSWTNTGTRPFSEGPVAYALGEIKSLQELAKNELLASATALMPPIAVHGRNFTRMNWNARAVNPGLITGDGKPLWQPMVTGQRPDFAQAVNEARRNNVREMLYLNLWQIILNDTRDTATAALIKAQEKGEMLGPVGISLNKGLSMMFDREVAILGRKRAFDRGSPLEMPDSMADKNVSPAYSSPLDRLRRMSEMIGMQRLVEFATVLSGGEPQRAAKILARLDIDDMLEKAQEILGAPASSLIDREAAQQDRGTQDQMANAMNALMALKGSGEAAKAVGEGGTALAQGAESVNAAPALQRMGRNLPAAMPQIANAAYSGMGGQAA